MHLVLYPRRTSRYYTLFRFLKTILTPPQVYISGRPFVLRDATEPRRALKLSDRAENLEAIEQRLTADILAECTKYVTQILALFDRTSSL